MKTERFDLNEDALLNKHEVARVLRCSVRNVDRLVAQGGLRRIKIGGIVRFLRSEVVGVIEQAMQYGQSSQAKEKV